MGSSDLLRKNSLVMAASHLQVYGIRPPARRLGSGSGIDLASSVLAPRNLTKRANPLAFSNKQAPQVRCTRSAY
jgi:hypothetical protein